MMRTARSMLLTAALFALPVVAAAQDEIGKAPPPGSAIRVLALSQDLADRGRAEGDPLMLILAADMRKKSGLALLPRAPEGGTADADPYAVETLLKEGVAAAKDAPAIRALADDVRASAVKGRMGGKGYSVATVKGAGTDWYRGQRFRGGEYAEIAVSALTAGSVDLFLYDAKGNLVCRDLRQPKSGYCGFTPAAEGTFDVKVENRAGAPLKYQLTTN